MIRAVLLVLGLVTGPFHVEVQFDSPPHAVEVHLDGRRVAELSTPDIVGAPWETWIDLGEELTPHELVVVSFDRDGIELDRATRWLNLPERDDGRDATPITILLDDRRSVPDDISDFFEVDGRPARVLEVTNPDAELWIVRDPRLMRELERAASLIIADALQYAPAAAWLDGDTLRKGPDATLAKLESNPGFSRLAYGYRFSTAWKRWHAFLPVDEDTEVRFVSPWGAPVSQVESAKQIHATTPPQDAHQKGVLYHLFTTRSLGPWYRLTDAVGIAGLEAAAGNRRRAVLVLTSDSGENDLSLYGVEAVRGFLDDLGVPVRFWSLEYGKDDSGAYWGPDTVRIEAPLSGAAEPLWAAHHDLIQALRNQRIVWIEGRHLPSRVRLSAKAHEVRMVR